MGVGITRNGRAQAILNSINENTPVDLSFGFGEDPTDESKMKYHISVRGTGDDNQFRISGAPYLGHSEGGGYPIFFTIGQNGYMGLGHHRATNPRFRFDSRGGDRVGLGVENTPVNNALLENLQMTMGVDEATSKLIFTVKLSDGTVKKGSLDLV